MCARLLLCVRVRACIDLEIMLFIKFSDMNAENGVVIVLFAKNSNQIYGCGSFIFSCICGLPYLRI